MEDGATTPGDLMGMAEHLRVTHLAHGVSLEALLHPDVPLWDWFLSTHGDSTDTDLPISVEKEGGPTLVFPAREVLTAVTRPGHADVRRDMLSTAMILAGLRLGDAIERGGFHRWEVPLLAFARHYRNACAHGGSWDFRPSKKHPWQPAQTRTLELSEDMNGQRAVWGTVGPYDHLLFLDEIRAYFATLGLQRAFGAAFEKVRGRPYEITCRSLDGELQVQGMRALAPAARSAYAKAISVGYWMVPEVSTQEYKPIAGWHEFRDS